MTKNFFCDSSRSGRDYRQRSLTPPPDRDRGMPYYDRDMGPAPRGYDYDRYARLAGGYLRFCEERFIC